MWLWFLPLAAAQVSITVQPRWPAVVPGREHTQALLVEVTPPVAAGDQQPQELALLIDVSLSMADQLPLVKSAVRQIVRNLQNNDRIHIISCQSFARPEFINGSIAEKAQMLEAVEALVAKTSSYLRPPDGGDLVPQDLSNISEGLWIAQRLLVGGAQSRGTRRVMLFSDGQLEGPLSRYNAVLDALESARVAGVSSTVVALGTGGWLEEAAQAGHGDYVLLHGLSGFQQAVAAASPSHYPTFATGAKLRLATSSGARLGESFVHRRRREHQRVWSEAFVEGLEDTDAELALGTLRHGRTERFLIVMELPVYLHGSDLLKYELLYEQMDGTSRSQWNKFTQHVAQNAAKWPGADLLYRLDQLLLEREALRRDEEVAEAQHLPSSRGDGNRWQLSERWRQLRRSLELLEKDASASQKQIPSLSQFSILEKIWKTLETTRVATRGLEPEMTSAPFSVCQGSPELREVPQGIEGLGLPNT